MELSQEQIERINTNCPEDQGVFREPNGVPVELKEPLVYARWKKGGMTGGGYHEHSYRHRYDGDSEPALSCLNLVLYELGFSEETADMPEIQSLIRYEDYDDDADYYMNYDEYGVKYIVLSELLNVLETLPKK